MLGVAQNAQRAGWGGGSPVALIQTTSKLGYRVLQTPSFSMHLQGAGAPLNLPVGGIVPFNGQIDVTGIGSLPEANNKRMVMTATFRLNWGEDLAPGAGNFVMHFFQEFRFWQPGFTNPGDFYSINAFNQFRDNLLSVTGRMETDNGVFRAAETLAGPYQDFNNRWLTFIYAEAESNQPFPDFNFTPSPFDPTPTFFGRSSVWDTETRTLLQTQDIAFAPTGGFVPYLDYAGGNNTIGTNAFEDQSNNNIGLVINTLDQFQREPWYIHNIWASFGQTFDPANPPDSSVFTTRPSAVCDGVEAWFNIQFVEEDQFFQVLDQGESRYFNTESNVAMTFFGAPGGNNQPAYDTAVVPRDRNI